MRNPQDTPQGPPYQQGQQPQGQQPQGQQPQGQQGYQQQPQQQGYQSSPQQQPQQQHQQPQQYQQQPPQQYQRPASQQQAMQGSMSQPSSQMAYQAQAQQMPQAQQMGGQRPQLRSVGLDDIVQTDVVTAQPDTPISRVVADMAEQDVGSVVVVEDDRPVGILTDRKVALALESTPDVAERQADELVSRDLVTASTDDTIFEVLEQMRDSSVRRIPIVDEDGTLQGIVTLDDILVALGNELSNATEIIESQVPRL